MTGVPAAVGGKMRLDAREHGGGGFEAGMRVSESIERGMVHVCVSAPAVPTASATSALRANSHARRCSRSSRRVCTQNCS
jgi:hypothetical protein